MRRLGETDERIPCHVHHHLSRLWRHSDRTDAPGCLPVPLHLRPLRCHSPPASGRLLRLLLLRHRPLPPEAGGARGLVMKGSRIAAPVGGVVAAGASVVCMASMGAMVAATTTSATAGMAAMGAAAASTPHVPAITRALRAVGLGALTHVPNAVLQPLLIILLLIAIGAALWRSPSSLSRPRSASTPPSTSRSLRQAIGSRWWS